MPEKMRTGAAGYRQPVRVPALRPWSLAILPRAVQHGRRFLLLLALACALGGFVMAGTAQAAYAPKLAVTIRPTNQPGKPIGLTSVVTQASNEEATRKVVVHFPIGIGFNVAALGRTPSCSPAQRDAKACPAGSRLGTATADTDVGQLTGGVFLGEAASIYIFLQNSTLALLGLEPGPITGRTVFRPDGGTDTVLDNLPTDVTPTRFELALDGPPKSVLTGPELCRDYAFSADFTSKNGVLVKSTAPKITITGCPPEPVALSRVRLTPRRLRVGRVAILAYSLNKGASVQVTVRRSGRRRVLGRVRRISGAGLGRIRVLTSRLLPGTFVVTIRAAADGVTASRSFTMRVLPRLRRGR
jgi:hypothetical protein